jgi:hypothetical protein
MRIVLGQANRLEEWSRVEHGVTSTITEVECLRTLDRQARSMSPTQFADRRGLLLRLIEKLERIALVPAVLQRASGAFPTPLGTLDAIHLSSAVLWSAAFARPAFATHDAELGTASRAMGFTVIGI